MAVGRSLGRFLVLWGLFAGFLPAAHAAITLTTIDGPGTVGQNPSMQLNASGFPVISYYDQTNSSLKLVVCGDANCTTSTITTVDAPGNVGQWTSLRLNASGFAVISYYDANNGDLKLAVCNDATCSAPTITTVDGAASAVGQTSSLQLNASGFPVISYYASTGTALRLAVCGDATCSTSTITVVDDGGANFTGQYTSLQLNAAGFPVISYYDATLGDLWLATCNDATCTSSTLVPLDITGDVGAWTSMRLNASGFPVISYWDFTNLDLKLLVCGDAACTTRTTRTLDSAGSVGQASSLQLDAGGLPVVTYYDTTNGDLKLARCNDATCSAPAITVLDNTGNVGSFSSLQMDAAGYTVVAYYDTTNGDLKLARLAPETVTTVTVPANSTYGVGQTLDFTVNWTGPVTVGGTPVLPITVGAAARNAAYVSGSGTNALLFRYVVVAGDQDTDGIALGAAINASGGVIFPAGALTLNGVPSTAGVLVATAVAAATPQPVPTLSQWMLVLLAFMTAGIASFRLQRRAP